MEGTWPYYADGENIKNALLGLGVDASSVYASPRGDVAAALSESVYEQIWVYDLGGGVNEYEEDWQAIAAWFNEAPDRPIICDGRIISSFWNGRWQNEAHSDRPLAESRSENSEIRFIEGDCTATFRSFM